MLELATGLTTVTLIVAYFYVIKFILEQGFETTTLKDVVRVGVAVAVVIVLFLFVTYAIGVGVLKLLT